MAAIFMCASIPMRCSILRFIGFVAAIGITLHMHALLQDTKAIMGWNDRTVVIAFRGTASMANLLADLKVRLGLGIIS
jgi:hypothetical protein